MIWIESVRPVKESIKIIKIRVKDYEKVTNLIDRLSKYEAKLARKNRGRDLYRDEDDYYLIENIRVTNSELDTLIKELGLTQAQRGSYSSRCRYYYLKEEMAQV